MEEVYIKGQYRKSIFTSDSGYIIGIFKVSETNDEELDIYINRTITFTGYFHELNEVDTYKFYGKLVNHPKYGEQFLVEHYDRLMPEEKDSIVEFLSGGLFKGIGEAKAKRIVDVLGKDTFSIILENPSNLVLIPTITEKNAKTLHDKLMEYESSYETILYLNNLGFSTKDSMIVYNYYKEKTISVVEEDIYMLIEDVYEMTYKKIDSISKKIGIKPDDERRIDASILYIMRELSNTLGHCYFSLDEIYSYLTRVLGVRITKDIFQERVNELILNLKIKKYQDNYYVMEMYEAETLIVKRFQILNHAKDNVCKDLDSRITKLEDYFRITYNKDQRKAIEESFYKNILIITGGPGTGKTTIIKAILELYKDVNKLSYEKLQDKVALLAPTGRAAKRMSETTLLKASTIHRFLKWNKDNDTFQVNEYNKSKVEFVLVDEASMIDTYLFSNLLRGLSVNTKIILVGDYDQLPSVGPGQLLHDFICSNVLPVIELKELYRQGADSNIITLSSDIRNDSLCKDLFNESDDLTFIECDSSEIMNYICDVSSTYKDYSYKNFQILAPMYKTQNGIDLINQNVQKIFNKKEAKKAEIKVGEVTYREGDKVIQLTNMPDDNVYNGDIGIITRIVTRPNKEIYIDFDNNIVKYTPANFYKFKLAYAISIHKSQGSEFDIVVIPLTRDYKKMLYRKLIYTGITRSKTKLYLIGEYKALELAVANNKNDIRRTGIKYFLISGINGE